jgi:SAM-dependent methyltransferase
MATKTTSDAIELPDPADYGERWAEIYDDHPVHPTAEDAEPAADLLAELAGSGAALELGIGTGRIALPLAARGVAVVGVDASPTMLDLLAAKPGAERIQAVLGDITDVHVEGRFSLVFAAFNTVLMVPTQSGQIRCFENAAAHLEPEGHFVVEAFVPEFEKLALSESVQVRKVDDDGAWLLAMRHDPLEQLIASETIRAGADGMRRYPTTLRWAFPPELDLMARLAGFSLVDRYESWSRAPFTKESRNQVSVYRSGRERRWRD